MGRLLGYRFWTSVVAAYVGLITFFDGEIGTFLHATLGAMVAKMPFAARFVSPEFDWRQWAPGFLTIVIAILFMRVVWRIFWRIPGIGAWLSDRVFPDLNGEWDVEMYSNYATVEAMRVAAADTSLPRFHSNDTEPPLLTVIKPQIARIEQNWLGLKLVMKPTGEASDADPEVKNLRSVTLSFDLLRKTDKLPHRIAYVFEQTNRDDNRAANDEKLFLGAAYLDVSDDASKLTGVYFNNRNWTKGMNLAGTLKLTRRAR